MGFLSRKTKPAPVIDEAHPMEEELEQMERAVPVEDSPARPRFARHAGREAEDAPVDGESPSPSADDDRI